MTNNSTKIDSDKVNLVLKSSEVSMAETSGDRIHPSRAFIKVLKYDITVEGEDDPVGHIIFNTITPRNLAEVSTNFKVLMDGHSHDLSQLALVAFTRFGVLKPEVYEPREGGEVSAWSKSDASAMAKKSMCYIEELVVQPDWQLRGVGSRVLQKLFETDVVRKGGCQYVITWPTVLNHYEPHNSPVGRDKKMYDAKREQIISFFRKVGYRRLGNTQFFMMAKDPEHASRQLRPEDDLPYEEPNIDWNDPTWLEEMLGF